jgi:hypothetical protein
LTEKAAASSDLLKEAGNLRAKARLVRDAIDDLLDADDDLAAMYLTERARGLHEKKITPKWRCCWSHTTRYVTK